MAATDHADVVVIGGGLVGISSAYFLSKFGYRVTVVERREELALETSFANAGRFCPTALMGGPLASPSVCHLRWPPLFAVSHSLLLYSKCACPSSSLSGERTRLHKDVSAP